MFIVHNAIRNLWRNKGRSVLIIIVATIIAAASTIGFAIVQAAQRARASALENTTIGAQISLDRNKIMQSANSSGQKPVSYTHLTMVLPKNSSSHGSASMSTSAF